MRKRQMLILAFLCLLLPLYNFGQIIYYEPFTGQEGKGLSGMSLDLSGVLWTIETEAALPADGYIRVIESNGDYFMEGHHVSESGYWISPVINIDGKGTVKASLEAWTLGNSKLEKQDFLRAYYSLDNQPLSPFAINGNLEGDIPNTTTMEQAGLEGKKLQIVIEMKSSNSNEEHRFDDILVEMAPGTNCPGINGDQVYISEFHYKGRGTKFVEITGVAGTDLSDYQLIFLNSGANSNALNLSGMIPDQQDGYGTWVFDDTDDGFSFASVGKGGLALYNQSTGEVIYYIYYGAPNANFESQASIVQGMTPIYAGQESDNTRSRESLQLNGVGFCPGNLSWSKTPLFPATPGQLNQSQLLPIELIDFRARLQEGEVWLEWQTATESNNDYMAVERSADGQSFEEIGRVAGAGNTLEARSYQLIDPAPLPGINYYRLQQVDFDGTVTYHRTVSVQVPGGQASLQLFPTQARQQVTVRRQSTADEEGLLQVIDIYGRVLSSAPWPAGALEQIISVNALAPGHYFLRYRDQREDSSRVLRFVKQ